MLFECNEVLQKMNLYLCITPIKVNPEKDCLIIPCSEQPPEDKTEHCLMTIQLIISNTQMLANKTRGPQALTVT